MSLVTQKIQLNCDILDDGAFGPATFKAFKKKYFTDWSEIDYRLMMAQVWVESAGFTRLEENLNYTAQGLRRVFPKYFKNLAAAQQFAHRPQAIANLVYGNRLGNHLPNDGYTFRGSGLLQCTGKFNTKAFADAMSYPQTAENLANVLRSHIHYSVEFIKYYWKIKQIKEWVEEQYHFDGDANEIAEMLRQLNSDKTLLLNVTTMITRIVNGGSNGLADRVKAYKTMSKWEI